MATAHPRNRHFQKIPPVQSAQLLQESGKARTGSQSKIVHAKVILQTPTKTVGPVEKPTEVEDDIATAARKLTYSADGAVLSPSMADVVKGNRTVKQGMNLIFYFLEMKDGI